MYFLAPVLLALAAYLLPAVHAHGRLTTPRTRDMQANVYEYMMNAPVAFDSSMVCRNYQPLTTRAVTAYAGSTIDVSWTMTALHPGDCFFYLSYDGTSVADTSKKFFKIAEIANCNQFSGLTSQLTLPYWIPSGNAILRWEWHALQRDDFPEIYAQCSDITIVNNFGTGVLGTPAVTIPGHIPTARSGYRLIYTPGAPFFFAGPALAVPDGTFVPSGGVTTPAPTNAVVTPAPTNAVVTPAPTNAVVTPAPTVATRAPTVATPAPTNAVVTPAPTNAVVTPAPTNPTPAPTSPAQTPAPTSAAVTQAPTGSDGCPGTPVTGGAAPAPATPAPTAASSGSGCVGMSTAWAKCGGQGYTGPTCCPSGWICTFSSIWYSQCLPLSLAAVEEHHDQLHSSGISESESRVRVIASLVSGSFVGLAIGAVGAFIVMRKMNKRRHPTINSVGNTVSASLIEVN